ncbi:MAG: DUF4012 domain-containing protein [Patescibacteria group bacterium]|nr:DUF4012 domain-containing protein [Patescibacteria group bacterium]
MQSEKKHFFHGFRHYHNQKNWPLWIKITSIIIIVLIIFCLSAVLWISHILSPIPPLADNWKKIAGFTGSQKYLFLFQNSAELRPTGGFLSAFGELTVAFGIPTGFSVRDSYAIPDPNPPVKAPEVIDKLFSDDPNYTGWTFRDANFSPDFPITTKNIAEFLNRAGEESDFDGIFAVDLHFLEDIFEIIGPIKINDLTFDKQSLFENLQFATKNFDKHNLSEFGTRKNILGQLGQSLIKKIITSPSKQKRIFSLIAKDLNEKHVLMQWKDSKIEDFFVKNNWSGILNNEPSMIQLAVVEANLGGRKSDRYLQRDIENQIDLAGDGSLNGRLTITLRHAGERGYYSNQFRGSLRIFLPPETKLIDFSGDFASIPTVSNDLGQAVFDTLIYVNPSEKATITYNYKLPSNLYSDKGLRIKLWKQPGTDSDFYRTILRVPHGLRILSDQGKASENILDWETFLKSDQIASIQVAPDIRPPLVAEQKFIDSNWKKILIEFDEPIQPEQAENIENYEIWDKDQIFPNQTDQIAIAGASYYDRGVVLDISGVTDQPKERYGIKIHKGILDMSGNVLDAKSANITVVQKIVK